MRDIKKQKEKLTEIIKAFDEFGGSDIKKRIDLQKLERINQRLIQFYDDCNECQKYTDLIIKHIEKINKYSELERYQELRTFNQKIKDILSHMQKKHRLIVKGHYMTTYMSMGLIFGAGLGVLLNNIALAIPLGALLGVIIGSIMDANYKKKGSVL